MGAFGAAEIDMKHPSSARPNPAAPALKQASLALRTGRPEEAVRLAAPVCRADPGNILAAQILGSALLMQGRAGEAIEPLQNTARRGHDASVETLLARALLAVGQRDEALDQLRLAVSRRPPFAQAFADLGDQLGELGRFDEAIAVFDEGLALMPGAASLRIGLGYLHLRRDDRATARELFALARAASPQRGDAVVALARVTALDGGYAAAADLYRQVLASRPGDAVVRIELAKCLLEMGQREAGEASLRSVARGGPALFGPTVKALAAPRHGRIFLRPSAAARFLGIPGE